MNALYCLTQYQVVSIEGIHNQLKKGTKYLSVAMTPGLGKKIIALFLLNKLIDENGRIAMVFGYKQTCDYVKKLAQDNGIISENVRFFTARHFLNETEDFQYIILYHFDDIYERKMLFEQIKNRETKVISFFDISDYLENKGYSYGLKDQKKSLDIQLPSLIKVYGTNNVLDVRDAKYAYEDKGGTISPVFIYSHDNLTFKRDQTINERDEIKSQSVHLQAYIDTIKHTMDITPKEQAAEIERLKTLLQEDEKNKTIEELKARVEKYERQIEEKDAEIVQLNEMNAFQQLILSNIGIEQKDIEKSFIQIQAARDSLKNEMESMDENIREIAVKQFQDIVAEKVSELIHGVLPSQDYKYYERYLIGVFSEIVWNKMDEVSHKLLVTAKCLFTAMNRMKDKETFDYSGVCLLVTKALEIEVAKRFFMKYTAFLEERGDEVLNWPKALKKKNRKLYDYEFTLGKAVLIMGYLQELDNNNNPKKNQMDWEKFKEFAASELFVFSGQREIEEEMVKDYRFIEKVRVDYRNPAAHRQRLTITTAKECFDYVLDVQHMLKEMLIAMKY